MEDIALALPVNPYVRTSTILRDVTATVGLGLFNGSLLAFSDFDGDSHVDLFARGGDHHGRARLEAWIWVSGKPRIHHPRHDPAPPALPPGRRPRALPSARPPARPPYPCLPTFVRTPTP